MTMSGLFTQLTRNSIARRFIVYVIILSVSVTFTLTVGQLYIDYQNGQRALDERFVQIQTSYLAPLTNSLTAQDSTQLQLLLEGIVNLPDIEQVKLNSNSFNLQGGAITSRNTVQQQFNLTRDEHQFGTLNIIIGLDTWHERLMSQALRIIATNIVIICTAALFMYWIFHWMIGKPLSRIARYMQNLHIDNLDQALVLDGIASSNNDNADELQYLANALNDTRQRLRDSYLALQESENYNRTLVEELPIGLVLTRLDGTIVDANLAFAMILGRTIAETLTLNERELIPPEYTGIAQKERQNLHESGRYGPLEKAYLRYNGDVVPVRTAGLLLNKQDENLIWSCVEDISEQQRIKQALVKAKQAAEQASRAKSQFVANMSHELRTPLNAIMGYSEMLKEELEDLEEAEYLGDVDKILAAGTHLLGLISDVLDISKIESGNVELHIEDFALDTILEEVSSTMQPLLRHNNNTLRIKHSQDGRLVRADLIKMRQILLNLVSNAVKFSENSEILLTADYDTQCHEWIFRVIDHGIGIAAEQLDKLFEAFSQADGSTTRKYGGSGLGLTISHEFSKLMGGRIEVKSELNVGSTFTVFLPQNGNNTSILAHADTPEANKAAKEAAKELVLVIDDDPIMCEMLCHYLERMNYEVMVAQNGLEGLQLARKHHPHVITLDVMMPQMDGWMVLSSLKSDPSVCDIPVVMLSIVEEQQKGLSLGASAFLLKPIDCERLQNELEKYQDNPKSYIMVIEDDDVTREMICQMLTKVECEIIPVRNGQDALHILESGLHPLPNLVLLDLMMPKMDGFTFAQKLRANPHWRNIPIVVLTAKDLTAEDRELLHNAVETVFQKGACTHEQLLGRVHDLIAATH